MHLRTIKLITICLCTLGIPDGSQCVLGLAYNATPTYHCIYMYISTHSIWRTASILILFIISIIWQFLSSTLRKSKQHLFWPDEIQVNPKFSCITSFFLQPSLYFRQAFTETRPMKCTVTFTVHFFILKNALKASSSQSHIPTWPLHWFYLKTMLGDEIIIYCFPVWLCLLTYHIQCWYRQV